MKLLYIAAWLVIIGFLVWSGNLLVRIQSIGSETTELHQLNLHLDSLAGAWRDLNRPGNDVLENYEVAQQRDALGLYIMLLVTLLASALSLELIRQSMRQREALRDAGRASTQL